MYARHDFEVKRILSVHDIFFATATERPSGTGMSDKPFSASHLSD